MSDGRSGLFCVFLKYRYRRLSVLKGLTGTGLQGRSILLGHPTAFRQLCRGPAVALSLFSARLRFSLLCDFIDQLIDFGRDRHERNGSTFTSNQLWQCSSIGKRDWAEENFDEFHLGSPINETRWEEESNDPTKIGEYSHHLFLPTSQLYGPIRFTRYAPN